MSYEEQHKVLSTKHRANYFRRKKEPCQYRKFLKTATLGNGIMIGSSSSYARSSAPTTHKSRSRRTGVARATRSSFLTFGELNFELVTLILETVAVTAAKSKKIGKTSARNIDELYAVRTSTPSSSPLRIFSMHTTAEAVRAGKDVYVEKLFIRCPMRRRSNS